MEKKLTGCLNLPELYKIQADQAQISSNCQYTTYREQTFKKKNNRNCRITEEVAMKIKYL